MEKNQYTRDNMRGKSKKQKAGWWKLSFCSLFHDFKEVSVLRVTREIVPLKHDRFNFGFSDKFQTGQNEPAWGEDV